MNIVFQPCASCRLCGATDFMPLLDFPDMPVLAEPVPAGTEVAAGPLTAVACRRCGYVFLREAIGGGIYSDYTYTPQISGDVVDYLRQFVRRTVAGLGLGPGSQGLEIGSGDGSLCREFNAAGVAFTGVEPSRILSGISRERNGVETHHAFMDAALARRLGCRFDLVVVRHVLEHIHDFPAFFEAIGLCLKPAGTLVVEVPYLGEIIRQRQFYAFFFEHLSYFSAQSLARLFANHGFHIRQAEFVHPEGGSILVQAARSPAAAPADPVDCGPAGLVALREAFAAFRGRFAELVRQEGRIAAYGAGQRGVTLLNLLGATPAQVAAIYDENTVYHGLCTPRSGIPVRPPAEMARPGAPETVLILASSYDRQIRAKYREAGRRFVSLSEVLPETSRGG